MTRIPVHFGLFPLFLGPTIACQEDLINVVGLRTRVPRGTMSVVGVVITDLFRRGTVGLQLTAAASPEFDVLLPRLGVVAE